MSFPTGDSDDPPVLGAKLHSAWDWLALAVAMGIAIAALGAAVLVLVKSNR